MSRAVDFVPGILVVAFVVVGLVLVDTPIVDIGRYALYLVLAVLVPGTLVHRALRGQNSMLIADWALGAATGVGLGLAAWALFMVLGIQQFLWLWPLVVYVPFLAVPGLRRHWRPGKYTVKSRLTSTLMAGAMLLYSAVTISSMRSEALPPRANNYYIDVYWHLANAAELTRRFPPDVPSVSGRALRYHWFANADMAHAHLVSGVDLPTIILRLWPIPIVAIVLGLVVALCHQTFGQTWLAGVAALVIVGPAQLMPWEWYRPISAAPLVTGSPSQTFGLISLLLGAGVLVDLVRKRPLGQGWWLLGLVAVVGVGSKPSVAPILVFGLGLVIIVNLVRREPVLRLVVALSILSAGVVGLAPLVAQATAASGIKVFGVLAFQAPWTTYATEVDLPATGGLFLAGLVSPGAVVLAFGLVAALLLQVAWVLAGAAVLAGRRPLDPAILFLAGAVAAGMAATLIVDHAGLSEIYFEKTAVPLGAILAVWGLWVALSRYLEAAGRRRVVAMAILGVVLGIVAMLMIDASAWGGRPSVAQYPRAIAIPLVVAVALALAGVVLWALVRWLGGAWVVGGGAVVACTALLASFAVQGPLAGLQGTWSHVVNPVPALPRTSVSSSETEAALWLRQHTPPDAVIATNVHCRYQLPFRFCDSRSYWITAFSERRALVESWAYTEENLNRIGQYKTGFPLFPFDDPRLLAQNDRVFTAPTPSLLADLRDTRGVTWLFADTRGGRVSTELARFAHLRYLSGPVSIYELKRP